MPFHHFIVVPEKQLFKLFITGHILFYQKAVSLPLTIFALEMKLTLLSETKNLKKHNVVDKELGRLLSNNL